MKKYFFLLLFILPLSLFAQTGKLYVEGSSSDPYILHVIQPKENFYSIGRIYNISPRVYAPYNDLTLESSLSIGQTVKIPLNDINFSTDGTAAEDEVIVPLYKKSGGGLFGYLKVKKALSPLAANAEQPKTAGVAAAPKEPAKEPVKEPVKQPESPAPVKPEPVKEPVVKSEPEVVNTPALSGDGYFKQAYQKQRNTNSNIRTKGKAFKSTSGWSDSKYYCFHNRASAGSIVAIKNNDNGKTIYAKVLDVVPDNSDNVGYDLILSDAAADALGFKGKSFQCTLSY